MLFPAYLCDTLLSLAEDGVYRPLWSTDILGELRRNLLEYGIAEQSVDRRIAQMRRYFLDAEITGYEDLVEGMPNDPKDRHVLAAAIRGRAEVIVTANLSDFPPEALKRFEIEPVHPDDFLLDQLDLQPGLTIEAVKRQAARYRRESRSVAGLLGVLDRIGLPNFAAELRRHIVS
ncbi:PIN domain-containing protein [Glycomyces halotolerans]